MADTATVKLTAENAQLKAGLQQSTQVIEKFASNVKTVFLAAAAVVAAKFGVDMFTGFIKDAAEAQRNSRVLERTVLNLGDAAAMAASDVEDYADAMERVEGIDGESTKKFMTQLLRMNTLDADQIKNATRAAADLGVALGTSFEDGAATLEMVFANPEMGLKKLRQVGVLFTETEQEMIKALMETGRQAEASDIILMKMHETLGGLSQDQAESNEGTWARFKQRLGDIGEQIGGALLPILNALLPVLDNVGQWLQENVGPAIEYVQEGFTELGNLIDEYVIPVFEWLLDAGIQAFTGLQTVIEEFSTAADLAINSFALACVSAFEEVLHFVTKVIPEYLSWFGRNWKNVFTDIGNLTTTLFSNLWKNVKSVWKSITDIFSGEGAKKPQLVSLMDGFQSSLEELPNVAAREMTQTERALTSNVDMAMNKLGATFNKKLQENRAAVNGMLNGAGQTDKQKKTEREWIDEQQRLTEKLMARGMQAGQAYEQARKEIDEEKKKEKEGKGDKNSMGNIEDLVALNARITKAAGSNAEEKVVDAVKAGAVAVAAAVQDGNKKLDKVADALENLPVGGAGVVLTGRNSVTSVRGT